MSGDYAVDFDNSIAWNFIDVANDPTIDLNDTISLDFWIKGASQGQEWIIHKRDTNVDPLDPLATRTGYEVLSKAGTEDIFMQISTSAASEQQYSMSGILNGNWHNVLWVLDQGTVKGYKDGALVVDDIYLHGGGFAATGDAEMRALKMAAWGGFVGTLDEVKIYSQVIPEPGSLLLLGTGLLGLVSLVRRKR